MAASKTGSKTPGRRTATKSASARSKSSAAQPIRQRSVARPSIREMLLIRRFEEKAGQLYGMGLIGGFCHLYIGQEAVVVGIQHALGDKDSVITGYRDHGHMLACGMDPQERHGRADRPRHRLLEGQGRLDAHVRQGEELLRRPRHRRRARCRSAPASPSRTSTARMAASALTYFGDGAVNQGQVYESFNMAALWKLPVVYVIENNHYGMGTSQSSAPRPAPKLCERGAAFGIPGEQVDGMDVRRRARDGQGGRGPCPRRQGALHPRDA